MSELPERKRVVLGITGSIAAYKAVELARILISRGYSVRVIMSESATKFISPLTLQAVTGSPVSVTFWQESEATGIGHIELADWAEAFVIAPATADCIAKLAYGFADEPLLAVALATKAPLLVAPAMNVNMYEHPKTQENIEILRKRGVAFVDPEEGALACGWNGAGRLAAPTEIFEHIRKVLTHQDLKDKRILITTGPTREPLDPVRFLSNRSSGKMGMALAREAFRRGAKVTLIHGPVAIDVPGQVQCVGVVTAQEMRDAVMRHTAGEGKGSGVDVVIMAAAVSDYRPQEASRHKLKKSQKMPALQFVQNPDILLELGQARKKSRTPVLVGFAVETGEVEELVVEVRKKLKDKMADIIVGNLADDAFDLDTNRVWLIDRNGRQEEIATTYKNRVANKILDGVLKL